MQTTRFGNQPAFEVLFHHLFFFFFFFLDECETATKARNISRHVEKHFRGKLQQTSLSADINENEWKQEKKTKKHTNTHTKKTNICRQRGLKKSNLRIIICLEGLFHHLFIYQFIYWPFSLFSLAVQLKLSIPQDCCS